MAFLDNIILSLESLKTNKLRAVLTMLGIIIGIGSVIAINTVGQSLTNSVSSSMSSLGATSITVSLTQKSENDENTDENVKIAKFGNETPDKSDLITDDMISEFRSDFKDEIQYIELTRSVGTGTITNYDDASSTTSVTVTGVNDEYSSAEEINVMYGRFIKNEKDADRKLCVVSDKFVEDALGLRLSDVIGQTVTLTINEMPQTFYITGVYEYEEETISTNSKNTETVTNFYVPLETARILNGDFEGYQSFKVLANSKTDTTAFLTTVGDYFTDVYNRNNTWTAEASSLESMISTFTEMLSTISFAIAAIAAISLIVGGIGVMNIMLVSITERTKEIGTRKALGATNGSIRWQFITEAIVICLIGGLIGVALGVSAGAVISKLLGYSASPSIVSIVLALGFSMLIGIIFGYAPANKAAKLDPIEALRYE
ncbi:MAG: ABC transporter permease [Acutalibacteraceae bacterium]